MNNEYFEVKPSGNNKSTFHVRVYDKNTQKHTHASKFENLDLAKTYYESLDISGSTKVLFEKVPNDCVRMLKAKVMP